jgi:hypothetical protein
MLECVCRPRFFAGQLLNADDLNRLDAYIRAKNRLHNRQLHGWGVVNGLEVTCNPCGAGVTVSCGYALSPCGEDIVVCDATQVDVCTLIQRCKDAERLLAPCDPPSQYVPGKTQGPCDAAEEDWVLAIRYAEAPARGIKPLYSSSAASCGCGCGGNGGSGCTCKSGGVASGCGCASTGARSGSTARAPRGASAQCEATVICEGFEFEVYRVPPEGSSDQRPSAADSPLLQRFECCVQDLVSKTPQAPAQGDAHAFYLWALRVKDFLLRYLQGRPGYQCELIARLQTLAIPDPANGNNAAAFQQALQVLFVVYVDALLACLCAALLPPCPEPSQDQRVPLAVLHVSNSPCSVLRVCNWSTRRKFATTFPALQYWLSVTPVMRNVRKLLEQLCCFDLADLLANERATEAANQRTTRMFTTDLAATGASGTAADATASGGTTAGGTTAGNTLQERMLLRLNPALADPAPVHDASALIAQTLFSNRAALTPQAIAGSLLGAATLQRESADRLSTLEAAQLPQFLMLQQLVKPVSDAASGAVIQHMIAASLFGGTSAASGATNGAAASSAATSAAEAAAASEPPPAALDALRKELDALKAQVDSQSKLIAKLQPTPPKGAKPVAPKRDKR